MLEGSLGVKGLFLFNEALLESGCGDLWIKKTIFGEEWLPLHMMGVDSDDPPLFQLVFTGVVFKDKSPKVERDSLLIFLLRKGDGPSISF